MGAWRWVVLAGVAAAGTATASDVHSLDEDLGGPPSRYAEVLRAVARRSDLALPGEAGPSPVRLACVATPGDRKYVGIVQQMEIAAPLRTVEEVIADVAHYKDLFADCVDAHEVSGSRSGNRYVTAWEQRVPVFFVPNSRFELTYLVNRIDDGRVVFRYRLFRPGDLKNSDGVITLEALGPERTRFTEYDFFNARWGLLPETTVWRESLRGALQSDLAIKLKAENPTWKNSRIVAESDRLRRDAAGDVERCARERRPVSTVLPHGPSVEEPRSARQP